MHGNSQGSSSLRAPNRGALLTHPSTTLPSPCTSDLLLLLSACLVPSHHLGSSSNVISCDPLTCLYLPASFPLLQASAPPGIFLFLRCLLTTSLHPRVRSMKRGPCLTCCGTPAPGWNPPGEDPRYKLRSNQRQALLDPNKDNFLEIGTIFLFIDYILQIAYNKYLLL